VENTDDSERGNRLRPLLALAPYLARYRTKTIAALVALTVTSLATLSYRSRCGA
jgi:ATP-binding cassette subfamily B protein